jgi:CHAT domain-containing protein
MRASLRLVLLGPLGIVVGASTACERGRDNASATTIDSAFVHAESTYWHGAHDSARAEWTALLERAEVRGDSTSIGRALTRLAIVAWKQSNYPLGRQLSSRALTMRLRPVDQFSLYNGLGLIAYNEGRQLDARPLFDRAIVAARAAGDSLSRAKAVMNRGLADTELGEYALARDAFAAARVTAHALRDTRLEGKCLANQGMLAIKMGDPLYAVAVLDTARALYRLSNYADGEQNALGQLGVAYAAMGEPQRALATLDSALTQSRRQGLPQEEASNLQLLGEQYAEAGDFTRALDFLARAQTLNASLGLADERGTALRDAGEVYLSLGQTSLGRRHALEALAVHRTSESVLEQLADALLLARVYERDGRASPARAMLDTAGTLAERLATRDARSRVALAIADIADRSGSPRDVLRALDSARADLDGAPAWEGRALTLRARAYRRRGELDSAAAIGQRAVRAIERVRGRYASGVLRTAYAWENGDAYADLVVVLLRQRRIDDAFAIADAARGRALVEHLAEARSAALRSVGAARELVQGEALLRLIDELSARLGTRVRPPPNERSTGTDAEGDEMEGRIRRARTDYEALLERATAHDASGAAILGTTKLGAAAVQAALHPDEALLEYFIAPDRVVVFAVTPDSVIPITLDMTGDQIASRARVARELLGNRDAARDAAHSVLESLYGTLIAPVRRARALDGVKRLIVVPHGALVYLPFAALRSRVDSRFLVEDFTLLYEPSAAAFALGRRGPPRDQLATGATVALAPFPETLPATVPEARHVASATPGGIVLSGRDASERALRAALGTAALVHVATHAELNSQNPMFSEITMVPGSRTDRTDDGRLEVHELLGMRVRSTLVFLSGCETGAGPAWSSTFRRGEDFTTLAQAFLYAGAQSVVATLWRIEDGAAATFADHFYDGLRHTPAADALADAQRAMLRDSRYAAPFDWASYEIIGDDAQRPRDVSLRTPTSTRRRSSSPNQRRAEQRGR